MKIRRFFAFTIGHTRFALHYCNGLLEFNAFGRIHYFRVL